MSQILWKQRFENFEKAHFFLKEMLDLLHTDFDNKAYKMATVQAYEMDLELAWKTLQDYWLQLKLTPTIKSEDLNGPFTVEVQEPEQSSSRSKAKLWIKVLDDTSLTSHVYDDQKARLMVKAIDEVYFEKLQALYQFLKSRTQI